VEIKEKYMNFHLKMVLEFTAYEYEIIKDVALTSSTFAALRDTLNN